MIHWSHFVGSLWDNVLAAHVHPDNLSNKLLTFEAAIDEFVTTTLVGIGEHWPIQPHRRSQYVQFCFSNLKLIAHRATGKLLQLEGRSTYQLQVAVTSIARVRCQRWNTKDAYLLRHQMVTTLAAGLHLMCSVLVSNRSSVDAISSYTISLGKAEFDAAVDLLNDLAQGIALAQRVLCDLDQILPVVRDALTNWSERFSSFGTTADWSVPSDVVPPDAAELLPYKEQFPDIRHPLFKNGAWATDDTYLETSHPVYHDWHTGLEPGGRSSVLWV